MKIYGYARVSTKTQSIERQIRNILGQFPEVEIMQEAYTGTKLDRPVWTKLYEELETGDTIVFDSVSRMSRDARDGFALYKELFNKDVNLVFLKEPHINTDSFKEAMKGVISVNVDSGDTATDDLVNAIMAAVNRFMMNKVEQDIYKAFEEAQKEVDDLHQRTKEGIETARRAGKQIGNRKGVKLITKKSIEAKQKIRKYSKDFEGHLSDADTIKLIGISRNSFYKYKQEMREK